MNEVLGRIERPGKGGSSYLVEDVRFHRRGKRLSSFGETRKDNRQKRKEGKVLRARTTTIAFCLGRKKSAPTRRLCGNRTTGEEDREPRVEINPDTKRRPGNFIALAKQKNCAGGGKGRVTRQLLQRGGMLPKPPRRGREARGGGSLPSSNTRMDVVRKLFLLEKELHGSGKSPGSGGET